MTRDLNTPADALRVMNPSGPRSSAGLMQLDMHGHGWLVHQPSEIRPGLR
jgi:hypothetical protein